MPFFTAPSRAPRPLLAAALLLAQLLPAQANATPYVSELRLVGGSFCPTNWMLANGQTLTIADYPVLYAAIGTTYGGNGSSTFQLPNLMGRVPVGQGSAVGGGNYLLGQAGGSETVQLSANHLPAHSHDLVASTQPATHAAPGAGRVPAQAQNAGVYADAAGQTVNLAATTPAGHASPTPLPIRNPYLVLTWCIAVQGQFPDPNN